MQNQLDFDQLNERFESATPQEILRWAWEEFQPSVAATSSFQTQSLPLLHMIATETPGLPVFFLDTGFHFPETLAYRDQLMQQMGVNVQTLLPEVGHEGFRRKYGDLYLSDPDRCCYINKVEPLQRAKSGLTAWISGIRRDQTEARRNTPVVSVSKNGQIKVCPMVNCTEKDVWRYINRYDLPVHPLFSLGYMSIGCSPCTQPVGEDGDARSGRWAGQSKTECGLHVDIQGNVPIVQPEQK